MSFSRNVPLISVLSACVVLSTVSVADACVDGADPAELDLWSTFVARDTATPKVCPWDFVLWANDAYRTNRSSWGNDGYDDACNINLPYAKFIDAAFLVSYGLINRFQPDPFSRNSDPQHTKGFQLPDPGTQWHGYFDYEQLATAHENDFHDETTYLFDNVNGQGNAQFQDDEIKLRCPVFDMGKVGNEPAFRGADYMHESWHAWQDEHDFSGRGPCGPAAIKLMEDTVGFSTNCQCEENGHMCQAPMGPCTGGVGCDWFYSHAVERYSYGDLDVFNVDEKPVPLFHSPNQIQMEFLCDLVSHGNEPLSVRQAAAAEAEARRGGRFANTPSSKCTVPFMFVPAVPSPPTSGGAQCPIPGTASCDATTPCSGGDVCGANHCCSAIVN
jgi:hypothetical protein